MRADVTGNWLEDKSPGDENCSVLYYIQVVISNRKSPTGFQLVPTSVILNDLERRNRPYFALFHGIR